MKLAASIRASFLLSVLLCCQRGESAENVLLPTGRTPIILQPGTRNPFGQVVTAQEPTAIEATETEETRLRRIIGYLKVGGLSGSSDNLRILLGSLILKPGDTLPPLVKDQQEILKVKSITKEEVFLTFFDKETTAEPRLIRIPFKTASRVAQMLYGEAVESLVKSTKPIQHPGVQSFIEGSNGAELLNITQRKIEMMGVPKDAEQSKAEN